MPGAGYRCGMDKVDVTEAAWYDEADIQQVRGLLETAGAESIWVKQLKRNHNSKQQVFFGNDPSDLAFLPLGAPTYTPTQSRKKKAGAPVIQIPLPWRWVDPDGEYEAPNTKLCFYPQYPEVRLSGFLKGCGKPPRELMGEAMRGHEPDRCLFFGPVKDGNGEKTDHVVGLVVGAASPAALYVSGMSSFHEGRVSPVAFDGKADADEVSILENALRKIINRRLVPWRLRNDGSVERPYTAPNAPGLTLEAELGVGENAIPGPDFDVWELKAIKQKSLERRNNHRVTLFTPQPDMGWTIGRPQVDFVKKYGHVSGRDESGKPDEYYFTSGDINRPGKSTPNARLDLRLVGFTDATNFDPNGFIALYDRESGELAAGWSYLKLLEHWQRKHNRAAYVPYTRGKDGTGDFVEFGPLVTLGISTSFGLFLQAFNEGKAVYDPGDKATLSKGNWTPHSRSQFRINLNDIHAIYREVQEIDIRNDE